MIRSLTIGLPLGAKSTTDIEVDVLRLLECARAVLAKHSLHPRTLRYTLPPTGPDAEQEGVVLSQLRWVDQFAAATGVRWFCLPVDLVAAGSRQGLLAAALDGIARFERLFLNMILAANREVAVAAAYDAARLVLDIARKSNNGFDNFRVGASFNCPANAPFFPFSRHEGTGIAFSFALETTQIALEALVDFNWSHDAGLVRDRLVQAMTPNLRIVDYIGIEIAAQSGVTYCGLDASLAPMPVENVSVASLVERVTGAPFGSSGSVFATAFLTDTVRAALQASGARAVGFNGVMYSILEDPVLAAANSRRQVSLDGLLAMSTVCACGLDMVPVPGLAFPEEIGAVMLDVAALSSALDKPLGVRLLPIPNAHVNEVTRLNLDFLCDSRIVALSSNDRRLESAANVLGLRAPRH